MDVFTLDDVNLGENGSCSDNRICSDEGYKLAQNRYAISKLYKYPCYE